MSQPSPASGSSSNIEYIRRINLVINYIDQHYAVDMSLSKLASVASFSEYHFHRIFSNVVGESLYKYIQRVRLEKSAHTLRYDLTKPITDIALDCGFSSSSVFARAFKDCYGMSASQWRKGGHQNYHNNFKNQEFSVNSKDCKVLSKNWQVVQTSGLYIDPSSNQSNWDYQMMNDRKINVQVKSVAETTVAYIRHIGPFIGQQKSWAAMFDRLMTWASHKQILQCPGTDYFTIFRDDLNITKFEKFKCDVCLSVPHGTKGEVDIGIETIPAGQYAVAQFEIEAHEFEDAWNMMFRDWLPSSGYQPTLDFCFERYLNDPKLHPQGKHIVEINVPVKPL